MKNDPDKDISAIKDILKQYAVACNKGDFDLWMSLWSDENEVVQMPPETPSRIGKKIIHDASKPFFEKNVLKIEITEILDVQVYGNLGLTSCNYTLAYTPKTGGETVIDTPDGKALTIYKKQKNGVWKIYYDCFNSNVAKAI